MSVADVPLVGAVYVSEARAALISSTAPLIVTAPVRLPPDTIDTRLASGPVRSNVNVPAVTAKATLSTVASSTSDMPNCSPPARDAVADCFTENEAGPETTGAVLVATLNDTVTDSVTLATFPEPFFWP